MSKKTFWCKNWEEPISSINDCSNCYCRNYTGGYPDCQFLTYYNNKN